MEDTDLIEFTEPSTPATNKLSAPYKKSFVLATVGALVAYGAGYAPLIWAPYIGALGISALMLVKHPKEFFTLAAAGALFGYPAASTFVPMFNYAFYFSLTQLLDVGWVTFWIAMFFPALFMVLSLALTGLIEKNTKDHVLLDE